MNKNREYKAGNGRKHKLSVLVVDDSSVVRETLKDLLLTDRRISEVRTAADPFMAAERMKKAVPDVMTLDVEMPRMDGLSFLKKIMSQHPIPVVMCSSFSKKGSDAVLEAFELGAVEVIQKPKIDTKRFLEESRVRICDAVKAASEAKLRPVGSRKKLGTPKLTADAILAKAKGISRVGSTEKVVVLGVSTGGTDALADLLSELPPDSPGIVAVQHMPEHFTNAFANRLDKYCRISVKEAENFDQLKRGQALIAPGNKHVILKRKDDGYYVEVKDGPLVSRHRPSVDVLFRSAARYAGGNAIGVIMTGMGDDGAKGMLEMKEAGALTFAQDEESCVVFGMPREAIRLGGVDRVLSLETIAPTIMRESV